MAQIDRGWLKLLDSIVLHDFCESERYSNKRILFFCYAGFYGLLLLSVLYNALKLLLQFLFTEQTFLQSH